MLSPNPHPPTDEPRGGNLSEPPYFRRECFGVWVTTIRQAGTIYRMRRVRVRAVMAICVACPPWKKLWRCLQLRNFERKSSYMESSGLISPELSSVWLYPRSWTLLRSVCSTTLDQFVRDFYVHYGASQVSLIEGS